MLYNHTIESVKDVKAFFTWLIKEQGVINFHPDKLFTEYYHRTKKRFLFTKDQCKELNEHLDTCFELCSPGDAIYGIAHEVMQTAKVA